TTRGKAARTAGIRPPRTRGMPRDRRTAARSSPRRSARMRCAAMVRARSLRNCERALTSVCGEVAPPGCARLQAAAGHPTTPETGRPRRLGRTETDAIGGATAAADLLAPPGAPPQG